MHDEPSPLLAQVPLTVSPFINLPKPPTLPHNYASLPSTLPPSILNPSASTSSATAASDPPHPYVTAPNSSFSAHPSQIIAQNRALLAGLSSSAREAEKKVAEWNRAIEERELAEKRRRAPGWLDREEKILEPARKPGDTGEAKDLLGDDEAGNTDAVLGPAGTAGAGQGDGKGQELGRMMDRAFGGLG